MPAFNDSFHWLDVEYIGELLAENYPDKDPLRVGFVELKHLVVALPGFTEQPGHACNEKILEAIQGAWISERGELEGEEE